MKLNKKELLLIGIIIIVILATLCLFVFKKTDKKEKVEKKEDKDTFTKYDALSDYTMIATYLDLGTTPADLYGYFYKQEKLTTSEVSNKVKIAMAIRNYLIEMGELSLKNDITIDAKDVETKVKALFGENTKFKHESLDGEVCSYTAFKYDSNKKQYVQKKDIECGTTNSLTIFSEPLLADDTTEVKSVITKVAFIESVVDPVTQTSVYSVYQDFNKTIKIADLPSDDVTSIKDSLASFKFTFKKDKNSFVLDTVELVK